MSAPKRTLSLTPASLIKSSRQKWAWTEYVPLGVPTICAGRGGEGKSTFALYIAAQITSGTLPGDLFGNPRDIIIVSHEDSWETQMKPRLIAAGVDLERVWKLSVRFEVDDVTRETVPALPVDIELLRQAIEETNAALVIVDPITASIGGDLHKVSDVRAALDPLAALASELSVAVIAIMHFNKGAGHVSDKISGSHAFRDASRSVLLFATDDETGRRVVSLDKSNYSEARGQSFAFELESVTVPTDDGDTTEVARVVYLGESDVSVSDIVNRTNIDADETDDRNAAQSFVLDYLKGCEASEANASDVLKAGRAAGFSENEIKNARKRSRNPRIASEKSGYGAGWVWAIQYEGVTQGVKGVSSRERDPFDTFVTPSAASEVWKTEEVG